jgi:hypothetical protein
VATRELNVPSLQDLRRRLAAVPGLVPASLAPPQAQGRAEEARIIPAELVEPGPVSARPVGPPEPWPETVAFLDGIQRFEVLGYAGAAPLLFGEIAAAVRERVGREARTVISLRQRLVIGRPEVLALAPGAFQGVDTIALETAEPVHPLCDLDAARARLDDARIELERRAGNAYRKGSAAWLVVDGSLTVSPLWAGDPRMLGVAKSHATLPFSGEDLVAYLNLPVGHRSNVFRPASSQRAPVHAWGLRLWNWGGKDLLYGLIRVEAAARAETQAMADRVSRWLLAERAPISADLRWDRLLYGIHGVEQYLRAGRGGW